MHSSRKQHLVELKTKAAKYVLFFVRQERKVRKMKWNYFTILLSLIIRTYIHCRP